MRILLLALWCIFSVAALAQPNKLAQPSAKKPTAWLVEKSSHLVIHGKANIGSISCDNPSYKRVDTVWMEQTADGDSIGLMGKIQVAMVDFNCHNYFFTSNLRKTLRVDHYPYMTVRFVKIDKLPAFQSGAVSKVYGTVEISLAGVSRLFTLPIEVSAMANGKTRLQGWRIFRLEDFNLKSPAKIPLVKVRNEFKVEFELHMARLN